MLKLEENNLISRSKSLLSLYHDAKRCENMSKSDGKRLQYSFLPIRNFRGIAWRLDYEQKELQAKELSQTRMFFILNGRIWKRRNDSNDVCDLVGTF